MTLFFVAALVISLASVLIGKMSILFVGLLFLFFGHLLINILSNRNNKKMYSRIYKISFIGFVLYALLCRLYMLLYDYDFLLVTDTITAYIPYTEDFMKMNSFTEMWNNIYGPFADEKYTHVGIITLYFTGVAKFVQFFDEELYFNLQLSIIFLSSFFPIFLYKMLTSFGISKAYKYTFIYTFLSIFFFYSTFILRDAPIALLYCIVFCYMFDLSNRKKSLVVFILCTVTTFLLRPQMGVFLLVFLAIPLIQNKNNFINVLVLMIFVLLANYIAAKFNFYELYEETIESGEWRLQEVAGDSTLNNLNNLPIGISQLAKLIFIQLSPIPCWAFLKIGDASTGAYNIMGLPRAIAVYYNYVIFVFIVFSIMKYKRIQFDKQIVLSFFIIMVFLALQSDTTEQRRMMSCYPILFLIALISYNRISKQKRRFLFRLSFFLFMIMQLIGISKYL